MFYLPQKKLGILRAAIWGIAKCGKTETLKGLVSQLPPQITRGNFLDCGKVPERDRELFLEYVPIRLGQVKGMDLMLELFAPHADQATSDTWLQLASDADGIVIVVDSLTSRLSENINSLHSLKELLARAKRKLTRIPMVCQFNKRDLPDALPFEVLERAIDLRTAPTFETVASEKLGLIDVVQALRKMLVRAL